MIVASGGKSTDCLLFLSHHTRPGAMRSLARIHAECDAFLDVIPIFDHTHERFPVGHILPPARTVTSAELETMLPYGHKNRQHPGTLWPNNIDLPVLWFFRSNPEYRFYWLIEYDVRYSGNWAQFFGEFAGNSADLLAIAVFDFAFRPGWAHWASFVARQDVPIEQRVRATLSFCRLSNRALAQIDQAYKAGVSGHYEVTIPTVLRQAGLTIEDLGGDGAYVAAGNRNRFYTNAPGTPGLAPGTFVLREAGMIKEAMPNMLWNPVKD